MTSVPRDRRWVWVGGGAILVVVVGGTLRHRGFADTEVDIGMGAALVALVVLAWLVGRRRP